MRLKRVVFPDPFGPMTLTSSPAFTSSVMPSAAATPPNRFVSPSISSSGRDGRRAAFGVAQESSTARRAARRGRLLLPAERGDPPHGRPEPLPPEQHHQDQDQAEDQLEGGDELDLLEEHAPRRPAEGVHPEGELLEDHRLEERQEERRQDDAPHRAHAAEHDHDQDHHGDGELEHLRGGGGELGDVERPRQPGDAPRRSRTRAACSGRGSRPWRPPPARPRGSPSTPARRATPGAGTRRTRRPPPGRAPGSSRGTARTRSRSRTASACGPRPGPGPRW